MSEFWEKTNSLESFSSEEKSYECRRGHLYTKCLGGARSVDKLNGKVIGKAETEEDPILSLSLDSESDLLYSAHKSKLIRAWKCPTLEPHTDFPAMKTDHKGPIILIRVQKSRLITASAESVLKVWDLQHRHCSGVLRNCTHLPLCLEYAEFEEVKVVVCGTNSGSLHAWNADDNEIIETPKKHNMQISAVTAITKSSIFASVGRDRTMIFWSLHKRGGGKAWSLQPTKVIPVFEEMESLSMISASMACKIIGQETLKEHMLSVGEKGQIRVWDVKEMKEVIGQWKVNKKVVLKEQKINQVLVSKEDESLMLLQDDLITHCSFGKKKVETFNLCSNQHEILDLLVLDDTFLIVATMSPIIKIYNVKNDNKLSVASNGHTDSVLAINSLPEDPSKFVSCGKDHSVCLWSLSDEGKASLLAKGSGHSSFVGAVACSSKSIFSASKDGILKVWKQPSPEESKEVIELQTSRTLLAHDQEINSVSVSLANDFVATASQDKTCKIWRISDMGLITTLTGHRRGIWRARFTAESLWTASADSSIKKWSIKSFQCLATFEGHLASVMSINEIDQKRLASVASDGLLKVWEIKTGEALGTFDAHDDKIWALAFAPEPLNQVITAGRDGNIFFWSDKTEEKKEEERQKLNEQIEAEQKLANFVHGGQLDKALRLSLRLDRPRQSKKLLQKLKAADQLETAVSKLDLELKNILLKFVTQWNTVGGASCELAQAVLQILLKDYLSLDKEDRPYKVDSRQLSGLLAYSDKHYHRLDKLQSRLAVVDLLLTQM